jgi:site-specific recombinase XerC
MNDLTVVEKGTEWRRMKALVLDSVSSPITKRVYNKVLEEFFRWYAQEARPGFTKATVSAWRVTLEERGLGSSSIIIRMSAIRKLAVEATDNGLLAPELAAGIQRVKSAKSIGVRAGNWLSLKQAQALLNAPDITTTKGLRDRAIIAVLLGCALRRSEVAALTIRHIQQRDGRWAALTPANLPRRKPCGVAGHCSTLIASRPPPGRVPPGCARWASIRFRGHHARVLSAIDSLKRRAAKIIPIAR